MRFYAKHDAITPCGWPDILPAIELLLRQRGINSPEEAEAFLSPKMRDMPPPEAMPGLVFALPRLEEAIARDEEIVVYGDYDADGVTAAAILTDALRRRGAGKVTPYIPSRAEEGYGLNTGAVRELANTANLIVTVDLGITALDEVRLCRDLGVDIIITDHHHPLETLPDTPWIVHPFLEKTSPFAPMCGAGVAWAIAACLCGPDALREYADLAALGTVADVATLTGVNRTLVAEGLKQMGQRIRPGLAALLEAAGAADKPVTAYTLGFVLGPRINAGGRLASSRATVDMLLAHTKGEAAGQAEVLCDLNRARIEQEREIQNEVFRIAESQEMRRGIVLEGDWHPGVVGIVASRLVERYHVPTVLLCRDGEYLTGSARSVSGAHVFKILEGMAHLFVRFGGHAMAAGMTLRRENAETFREAFLCALDALPPDVFLPEIAYDLELNPSDIDIGLAEQLERLAPYGMGNPTPVFYTGNAKFESLRTIGDQGRHLKAAVGPVPAVGFHMAERMDELSQPVDVVYSVDRNVWNGRVSAQMMLRDFLPSHIGHDTEQACERISMDVLAGLNKAFALEGEGVPEMSRLSREEARLWIMERAADPVGIALLCALPETCERMLSLLDELGVRHRFSLCRGAPPAHPRVLGALILAPDPLHPAFRRYRTILWCDGLWEDGMARGLAGAEQWVCEVPGWEERRSEFARCALPDLEGMREVWRWLKRHPQDLGKVKSLYDLVDRARHIDGPLRLLTALYTLRAAGHVAFSDEEPLRFSMRESESNPMEYGLCPLLNSWIIRDVQYAPQGDACALAPQSL